MRISTLLEFILHTIYDSFSGIMYIISWFILEKVFIEVQVQSTSLNRDNRLIGTSLQERNGSHT